ncbi:MAG: hypothetical protein QM737_21590 [Ferruginibacter sp.]
MKKIFCILCSLLFISCYGPIPKEKKIAVIAKLIFKPKATKGGDKTYIWFYKGKKYANFAVFPSHFKYDDHILIYIDSTNPNNDELPDTHIKIRGIDDLKANAGSSYYFNNDDLLKLDSAETYP